MSNTVSAGYAASPYFPRGNNESPCALFSAPYAARRPDICRADRPAVLGSTRCGFRPLYADHPGDFTPTTQAAELPAPTDAASDGFKRPGVASGHTQYRWFPQGSFTVHEAFGEGNPGTDLKYKKLNKKSRWSGTLGPSYNKSYESRSVGYERWPDENMWFCMRLPTGDHRQGTVIDYNRGPGQKIRQGQGFAIFLHANPFRPRAASHWT